MSLNMYPRNYSTKQACDFLGVSRSTLYLAIKSEGMQKTKVGNRTLLDGVEVRRLKKARDKTAALLA